VTVRIRLKKLGRKHRPFYRVCAMDQRSPRGGKVLEELGTYDPMVHETDARALLNGERINYWIGVGAQPSEKVAVLIKKYGVNGTHVAAQQAALNKLSEPKALPEIGPPASLPKSKQPEAPAATETPAAESAAAAEETSPAAEAPVEAVSTEAAPAEAAETKEAAAE
jgi:small subunit ribosomal protein S16